MLKVPSGYTKETYDLLLNAPHYCLDDPQHGDLKKIPCILTECECKCETCGFNKKESERRLKEGHFVGPLADLIFSIKKDDIDKISPITVDQPTHLVFKRAGVS